MTAHKQILTFIISIVFFGQIAIANCYFIRLNGYSLTHRADVFSWGEFSPLIGLEAGDYYHLSPSGQNIIDINAGEVKNLQGELYYIPQNLIDKNNQFSLRMTVLERDIDTSDDLVLPLSERSISLEPKSFILDSMRVNVPFQRFTYPASSTSQNEQSYQFEILRESQDCSPDMPQGRENDLNFRLQNKLKHLHLHIKHYQKPFLRGSHEYQSYRLPKIKEKSLAEALKITEAISTANARELILLGTTLEKLRHFKNFKTVWRDYWYLTKNLLGEKITIEYMEEKEWKKMEVPSLRFHTDWKDLAKSTAILPPKHWDIPVDK